MAGASATPPGTLRGQPTATSPWKLSLFNQVTPVPEFSAPVSSGEQVSIALVNQTRPRS